MKFLIFFRGIDSLKLTDEIIKEYLEDYEIEAWNILIKDGLAYKEGEKYIWTKKGMIEARKQGLLFMLWADNGKNARFKE